MGELIKPIYKEKTINQNNKILENFWEEVGEKTSKFNKENCVKHSIEIIKHATNMVLIYTRELLSHEILEALEKASSKGVRIYAIIQEYNKDDVKKFPKGIFKIFNSDIYSSFIIADPNTPQSTGLWINKSIISDNMPAERVVELKADVIRELWAHFSYMFFSLNEEIANGKLYSNVKSESIPHVSENLKYTSRKFMPGNIEESTIEFIALPEESFIAKDELFNIVDYFDDSTEIMVPLDDITKEFLEDVTKYSENYRVRITAGRVPYGVMALKNINNKKISKRAFMPDFSIAVNSRDSFSDLKSAARWRFIHEKKYSNIKGKVILWNSKWSVDRATYFQDSVEMHLKDVNCETIDDWLNSNCGEPNIPDDLPLARMVILKWKVHPPYLPKNAKKHPLYNNWSEFENKIMKNVDIMKDRINKKINYAEKEMKKKKHYIAFQRRAQEIIDKFDSIKNMGIHGNCVAANDAIKKFRDLEKEYCELVKEYFKDYEYKTELDAFEKGNNPCKQMGLPIIPLKSLPKVGVLYRANNKDYLVIKSTDDIDLAKKEEENYDSTRIVVKRGDEK